MKRFILLLALVFSLSVFANQDQKKSIESPKEKDNINQTVFFSGALSMDNDIKSYLPVNKLIEIHDKSDPILINFINSKIRWENND
ncbi:hypothetical protein [uncultured Shewanella sp.]|uniref:hypothetical protein n=1 Tax=uncultured Shewanella sp. TaxID=173975 RepID=UPI00260CF907|nr:hypothetical protein [uncultured Shewanella sp.]